MASRRRKARRAAKAAIMAGFPPSTRRRYRDAIRVGLLGSDVSYWLPAQSVKIKRARRSANRRARAARKVNRA